MSHKEELLSWRKASASADGNCVEVAALPDGGTAVRDTKDEGRGPILRFTRPEWLAFLDGARRGEFNDLTNH